MGKGLVFSCNAGTWEFIGSPGYDRGLNTYQYFFVGLPHYKHSLLGPQNTVLLFRPEY